MLGVPIVPLELCPDSTPGEVLGMAIACFDCGCVVSVDLSPFPFARATTDDMEASALPEIIENRNKPVISAIEK